MRERKRRGKTSRKDTAQQDSVANAHSPREHSSEGLSPTRTHTGHENQFPASQVPPADDGSRLSESRLGSISTVRPQKSAIVDGPYESTRNDGLAQNPEQVSVNLLCPQSSVRPGTGNSPTAMSLNCFSFGRDCDRPNIRRVTPLGGTHPNRLSLNQMQPQTTSQQNFQGFGENVYLPVSPPNLQAPTPGFRFGATGESPLAGLFGTSPIVGSPGWLNLPCPPNYQNHHHCLNSINTLRFPVLKPL